MDILERIRHARPDDSLVDVLGLHDGDRLSVDKDGLRVGAQTIPLVAVLSAMKPKTPKTDRRSSNRWNEPAPRTVEIRDLG